MYNTEKDFFIKWVKPRLRTCPVHRVESSATTPGFPDSYVQGINTFIEFKNEPQYKLNRECFRVHWRPGQQAFATQELYNKTLLIGLNCSVSKCSWTFMAVDDGVVLIKHSRFFPDNKVYDRDIFKWDKEYQASLVTFLKIHSFVVTVNDPGSTADFRIRYIRALHHVWGLYENADFHYDEWFDDDATAWDSFEPSDLWQLENIAWDIYINEVKNGRREEGTGESQ